MYFSFKSEPQDFIVKEELSFEPSGNGDFFYVFFEKQQLNTMDIISFICKNFNLHRKDLGITGLKDKDGITQQWISISKKKLKYCGGESQFLKYLTMFGNIKILDTNWNNTPLHVGENKGNSFLITLKKREVLPKILKKKIEDNLLYSKNIGVPNIYGYQRFGKGNKNYKKVLKFFSGEEKIFDGSYEIKFKLQTFGSLWFNEYVMRRREDKKILLDGDIMVNGRNAFGTEIASYTNDKLIHFDYRKEKKENEGKSFWEVKNYSWSSDYINGNRFPTGPVLGTEQLVCKKDTPGRIYDEKIIFDSKFLERGDKILKKFRIFGYRRPLRVIPQNLSRSRDNGNLILKFFLPTGCYASSYLAFMLKEVDPKGCESNNLKVLRINQDL